MDLLKYEFMASNEGSYNYQVGQLVKLVRHYRENVPIEGFKAAIPKLKVLEVELQKFDVSIGRDHVDYIQEIMDELEKESEIQEQLIDK